MTNVISGLDALNMLNDEGQGGQQNKFTPLNMGDSKTVRVIELSDVLAKYTYSIYKQVPTFAPEKLPKLSDKGNPYGDYTPFDLAFNYHMDKSKEFGDEASQEAYKYKIKPRFAFGFYDLDEKKFIVIDFSKKQGQSVKAAIEKQKDRLDKRAFELEKDNNGTVHMTPEPVDDLKPSQQKAFEEAPKEFDKSLFENLYFTRDEEQMKEALQTAGFDLSLIGLEPPKGEEEKTQAEENPYAAPETLEDPTQNF